MDPLKALHKFVIANPRMLVLTGAGCSLASGIPTYRNKQGQWQRSNPIQHQDFLTRQTSRKRYWARSFFGWPTVAKARPNAAHRALAYLEQKQRIDLLITQNVDRLHQQAGHNNVIDLHGRLDRVICLQCCQLFSRDDMQQRLAGLNSHLSARQLADAGSIAPDGDADASESVIDQLIVPDCPHCGGILKPDVVFYGGSVRRELIAPITAAISNTDALLIVGSSLMVFSAYRFCRMAKEQGKAIACINQGTTRADELIDLKIDADCTALLERLSLTF